MTDHEVAAGPVSSHERPSGGRWRRWHLTSRDMIIALTVAALTISSQALIDDRREDKADRRENLRFLREQSVLASLEGVDLRNLDLAGQNLSGLGIQGAGMTGAILAEADLRDARMTRMGLSQADLSRADMSGAHVRRGSLYGANLSKANLNDAVFDHVELSRADFTGAQLRGAVLTHYTDKSEPDPPLGDFRIRFADFSRADLRGADLSGIDFLGVSFHGADLRGASLDFTYYESICYDFTTRWPRGFQPPQSAPPDACRPE